MKARAEREATAHVGHSRGTGCSNSEAEESDEDYIHDSMVAILNEAYEGAGIGIAGFSSGDKDY